MDYPEVVITSFARTQIGSFLGSRSFLPAAAADGGRRAFGEKGGAGFYRFRSRQPPVTW